MKFSEKFYAIYQFIPFAKSPKFLLSYLFCNNVKVLGHSVEAQDYATILNLFSVKRYAKFFDGKTVSFDDMNYFTLPETLDKESKVLLQLFNEGIRDGAYFIDEHHDFGNYKKTLKIIQSKNILETHDGLKFHLDSIGATVEIFVRMIHRSYSENLEGKTVIDIGASVGDTPLYFASKGATVYAVEMTDTNYHLMLKNIDLNPHLKERIIPIHMAFGKDEMTEYHDDALGLASRQGGASFVKNKFAQSIKKQVQGTSLSTLRKKYNLSHIDLLKLDCKGGEFFLKESELSNIDVIKIEYYSLTKEHTLEYLTRILEKNFHFVLYKHTPTDTTPMATHGNILALNISLTNSTTN